MGGSDPCHRSPAPTTYAFLHVGMHLVSIVGMMKLRSLGQCLQTYTATQPPSQLRTNLLRRRAHRFLRRQPGRHLHVFFYLNVVATAIMVPNMQQQEPIECLRYWPFAATTQACSSSSSRRRSLASSKGACDKGALWTLTPCGSCTTLCGPTRALEGYTCQGSCKRRPTN